MIDGSLVIVTALSEKRLSCTGHVDNTLFKEALIIRLGADRVASDE